MNDMGNLMVGLSSIIWPLIIFYLIVKFSGPIKDVFSTARTRGFTIKVGGNELTFTEASRQQLSQINDLQEQIVRLAGEIEQLKGNNVPGVAELKSSYNAPKRILWVDDYPSNNATIVAHLTNLGMKVETALTTKEGLERFHADQFDMVITDMGRNEEGSENPHAGIDLTKAIRSYDDSLPILIFCSRRAKHKYEESSKSVGANLITSSAVQLLTEISRISQRQ